MKRGLTLVELAVALALLGVLALGLALLLGRVGEGSRRAQAEAQLQADLQEVRARLTEDVLLSTALTCTPTEANLSLPSGPVTYALSGGQVLRNGVPLTLQGGYGGGFSCDGRSLTLDLTWEGEPVVTVTATRRIGLALEEAINQDEFPMDVSGASLRSGNRQVENVKWSNRSGQILYLQQIAIADPIGVSVVSIRLTINGSICYFYGPPRNPVPIMAGNPAIFQTDTITCSLSPSGQSQTLALERLAFDNPVPNRPIRIIFTLCLDSSLPCPSGWEARLEYRFECHPTQGCMVR